MARQIRKISRSGIYHVILRGVNKQRIFEAEEDYEAMYRIIRFVRDSDTEKQAVKEPNFFLYAYCLMDNHVHLLIQPNGQEMGRIMTRISTTYAIYFNNTYDRVGHLFQDRYKSEVVEDAKYFYTLLSYIHKNPVKAGLCETVDQYPFSSYRELVNAEKGLCSFPEVCSMMEMIREENKDKTMNLLGVTPDEIRDYVRMMGSENEVKGLLARLKTMTRESDSEICRLLRLHLDWQTEQEKDDAIVKMLLEMTETESITEFQRLEKKTMRTALALVRDSGVADVRLARLTGIPRGIIRGAKIYLPEE